MQTDFSTSFVGIERHCYTWGEHCMYWRFALSFVIICRWTRHVLDIVSGDYLKFTPIIPGFNVMSSNQQKLLSRIAMTSLYITLQTYMRAYIRTSPQRGQTKRPRPALHLRHWIFQGTTYWWSMWSRIIFCWTIWIIDRCMLHDLVSFFCVVYKMNDQAFLNLRYIVDHGDLNHWNMCVNTPAASANPGKF